MQPKISNSPKLETFSGYSHSTIYVVRPVRRFAPYTVHFQLLDNSELLRRLKRTKPFELVN
jgi:hypothetical protein